MILLYVYSKDSQESAVLMVNEAMEYHAHNVSVVTLIFLSECKFYLSICTKGLINAAEALRLKLEGEGILHRAFNRYPVRTHTN